MFLRVSVSDVRSEAIMRGRAAFLAPDMGIDPLSCLPPVILILSMPALPIDMIVARS
jgi:hypothetical protein